METTTKDLGILGHELGYRFAQPFLVIGRSSAGQRFVDVGGESALAAFFLDGAVPKGVAAHINILDQLTPTAKDFLVHLGNQLGRNISHVSLYAGSAGPHWVLRHGVLFERIKVSLPDMPDM